MGGSAALLGSRPASRESERDDRVAAYIGQTRGNDSGGIRNKGKVDRVLERSRTRRKQQSDPEHREAVPASP